MITNLKQENTHRHCHFLFFSGPNRVAACSAGSSPILRKIEINGAGAICCENSGNPSLGACQSGLFRLGSGDDVLQKSVCCSGRDSCSFAEFTGSPLSALNCDGRQSCLAASALLAGDFSCNGREACLQSKMNFSSVNEYPGFAFLVIFSFLALLFRRPFFFRRLLEGNPRYAVTCSGNQACGAADLVFLADPRPKLMN